MSDYVLIEASTYKLLLTAILRSQGLRIERDDNMKFTGSVTDLSKLTEKFSQRD